MYQVQFKMYLVHLFSEFIQYITDIFNIRSAEKADVDQERVEEVQLPPFFEKAGAEGAVFAVTAEKGLAEGAEQGGEGQFHLGVGVIDRRIDEGGDSAP